MIVSRDVLYDCSKVPWACMYISGPALWREKGVSSLKHRTIQERDRTTSVVDLLPFVRWQLFFL